MSDDEKLGYHKGALESLINEKIELNRLVNIVNSLINKHSEALKEMGVDVEEFAKNVQKKRRKGAQDAHKRKEGRNDEVIGGEGFSGKEG